MLSPDLANLHDVQPRALVQAVKRNIEHFPANFMFQLNAGEFRSLKSQIVTSILLSAPPCERCESTATSLFELTPLPFREGAGG